MLDHMVERSELRRSTGEQSKSERGNWYYWILQMGKEKRDARPAVVTGLYHMQSPSFKHHKGAHSV